MLDSDTRRRYNRVLKLNTADMETLRNATGNQFCEYIKNYDVDRLMEIILEYRADHQEIPEKNGHNDLSSHPLAMQNTLLQ